MYIVREHGILNLWRGNLMNIARIFPYSAIVLIPSRRILLSLITFAKDSTKRNLAQSSLFFCAEPPLEPAL